MCTALFDNKYGAFFGRTLDFECSFGEKIMRVAKGEPLRFTHEGTLTCKHAILGMAYDTGSQPLFYDALNDAGLCAAALNFPSFANYRNMTGKALNLASFEMISYILSQCDNIYRVKSVLENATITHDDFSCSLKSTPLHWIFADKNGAIVVESVEDGLQIYDDSFGVMTNSPPFSYHAARICDFSYLSPNPQKNNLLPEQTLAPYSRGLGAFGLPGDYSSSSRFIRAVFAKEHTLLPPSDDEHASAARQRIFDILGTVSLPYGIARSENGDAIYTVYTSCIDIDRCEYSYITHRDRTVRSLML